MRFRADGPSIPVELLEQRDRGNVVFFCGAGLSKPAGLPSFPELAKRVMTALGTGADSKIRALLEQLDGAQNLDRVFNLLQQEYKREEVDEAVNRILRTPRRANTAAHAMILRLSRSAAGRPQVVTTNFDHLFERVDRSLSVHVGPALPDIRSAGSFEGLVYLHGRRWNPGGSGGGSGKGLIIAKGSALEIPRKTGNG
jgi:NAD-dependent SIR2 family protein deacetylase